MKTIKKVLVANRGEIAIRIFRACTELNIRTVAIYSKEDTGSYHRYKADEAYLVGEDKKPIDAYLDIEGIIKIAKKNDVDAIHPGYGFLSENIEFAKRCEEEGIIFIGPKLTHLEIFGDKVKAREAAEKAGLPVVPGKRIKAIEDVYEFVSENGYPIIIKAALGGGGRGMRIVQEEAELKESFQRAKSEAKSAFGSDEVYVEKFLPNPKHIEVQILADQHGNTVHLYERDCSVQRRHQKLVEVAPSVSLPETMREDLCQAAVRLMENTNYINAGTVEFLVAIDSFYFIEVNPRIQVEHTITELITGIDIVQSQILIAQGYSLFSKKIGIPPQSKIKTNGYGIQCRVTTEDPLNHFLPDTGKINVYRSSGGFGVRLDAGNGFQGAVISPHYDSLLVKVSTWGMTFEQAAAKMIRNLKEFRIRGIKTNIAFLENVIAHPKFQNGDYDTSFVDTTPELFQFPVRKDRATKMLTYIGDVVVNGFPGIGKVKKPYFNAPRIPQYDEGRTIMSGTKQILDQFGPEGLVDWIHKQEKVLITDTTFRDAHQSLLATRVRTYDLLKIAEPTAHLFKDAFSLEMWGGATFDVSYRFLKEDPWQRLIQLRKSIPNILFQMLLRGSNAVGYKNYPDNVIREFVKQAAESGIDVFRIFDSLNWLKGMEVAIEAVRETGKIAEAAICYTGDILDRTRTKYSREYYVTLAKELEKQGAHILAIKDMAGLLKPKAAYELISALKDEISIPIHLHTHDTSGNGIFTYAKAIEAGVDIVDTALSSMAGFTSQPSVNSLYYALQGMEGQPDVSISDLNRLANYWEDVRQYYCHFESGMKAPHAEVYDHEMPGGQYSNLQQQAKAVGLIDRWDDVKDMYRRVNYLFGDIVKVTPSSKVIGDMALFMVQNDLSERDVLEKGMTIDFPQSVIEFFQGYIGIPTGGFPKTLQKIVLKNRHPLTKRAGDIMEPIDFDQLKEELFVHLKRRPTIYDVLAYALYPKVFEDYAKSTHLYGDISRLDTPTFLFGLRLGEEVQVEIEQGKTLIIRLVSVGQVQKDGTRIVYFELNGQPREIVIKDVSAQVEIVERKKVDPAIEGQIGATMPGTVVKLLVEKGEKVTKGDHLVITEAMKMETTVQAPFTGTVEEIYVEAGDAIKPGDLLIEIRK
ncbi:pyruvate carboxylase [Fervidibacillus albus]|uniref:Pyruvate carboxylase n=1 Tax=Fervidibacillus albus TaxID=2980026 RepID=A0A9E8LXE0_9BACI|nr:pyruvate carboxylase [Fervidibacillus albus]WAA11090.1 pyruvate carboxylase [Fervidibacillus albus]